MLDDLLLLSGADIPFPRAQLTIHQPRLKELAFIGEEKQHLGCQFLTFNKSMLSNQDKINLKDKSDFEILLTLVNDRENKDIRKNVLGFCRLLSLMFPTCIIKIEPHAIALYENEVRHEINKDNFGYLRQVAIEIFCLNRQGSDTTAQNPVGSMAQQVAEQLERGRAQAAMSKPAQKIAILSLYSSILAVGLQKDLNSLMEYTPYQLQDEFERYHLRQEYDMYIQAKMAGAKDIEEVENWMKDIHS